MNKIKLIGITIAATVAFGFTVAPVTSAFAKGHINKNSVRCYGINPCKGSECETADNSCQSAGNCKGKGYKLVASRETCKLAGGSPTQS